MDNSFVASSLIGLTTIGLVSLTGASVSAQSVNAPSVPSITVSGTVTTVIGDQGIIVIAPPSSSQDAAVTYDEVRESLRKLNFFPADSALMPRLASSISDSVGPHNFERKHLSTIGHTPLTINDSPQDSVVTYEELRENLRKARFAPTDAALIPLVRFRADSVGPHNFERKHLSTIGHNPLTPERPLRPDGVHTRIIPAWSPGLYQ